MTHSKAFLFSVMILAGMSAMAQTRGWDSVKAARAEKRVIAHFNSYDPTWDSVTKCRWRQVDSVLVREMDETFDAYASWDSFIFKTDTSVIYVSKLLIPYRTL
jgi:hypothetical protein